MLTMVALPMIGPTGALFAGTSYTIILAIAMWFYFGPLPVSVETDDMSCGMALNNSGYYFGYVKNMKCFVLTPCLAVCAFGELQTCS